LLRIITCRRLRRNRRGISNVIVVALSLVIILAIVSNLVLWNYEMNEVDWEKMKESISITNVEDGIYSSWFVAQSEYAVTSGSRTDGGYADTQTIDSNYEVFSETAEGGNSETLIDAESFEDAWTPEGWSATGNWAKESNYAHDGMFSADFDGWSGDAFGYLTSSSMDCSDTDAIYLDFWWNDHALDNNDFTLEYYNGSVWNLHQDLNQVESGNGWHHYTENITDSQYFVSDFQIRWVANNLWSGESAQVDEVTVTKSTDFSSSYFLDISGPFVINLGAYPREDIRTVEIHLRFRTDDSAENWILKAYNWESSTYSNIGFNSTEGYTPTMRWDYYAVNLTDMWQNYVRGDGTIDVKLVDEGGDSAQTAVRIDFLGVRVKTYGTRLTFKNVGGLTVHLVSLWITNSTDHQRIDIDIYMNSAETQSYRRDDISLPTGDHTIKVVTERGNTAVYSGS
jgi:hypothetical protein